MDGVFGYSVPSLSPLLFAIYIADMAEDIALADFGFNIGGLVISGLLLADDLVLLSRTAAGLKSLIMMVKIHADSLKMQISESKSEVISPAAEEWNLLNDQGDVTLSLQAVVKYKYLGVVMYNSMHKTGLEKQEQALTTARRYKGACLKMSRMGPDTVMLASTCWSTVAIPSILFGCNIIPFTETKIEEIERLQSQLAKSLLGLSIGSPNFSAQESLGWKTFRHHLFLNVLTFYFRLLHLPEERWSQKALVDHLEGKWTSPYLRYIHRIRSEVMMLELPASTALISAHLDDYFLTKVNSQISDSKLPALNLLTCLKQRPFILEVRESMEVSRYRYFSASLGNHAPRLGFPRRKFCVLCPGQTLVSEMHLMRCPYLMDIQSSTGISSFINLCLFKGLKYVDCFSFYVNGLDVSGVYIGDADFKARGRALMMLTETYMSRWK